MGQVELVTPAQQRIINTLALLDGAKIPIGAALNRLDPESGERRLQVYSGLVDLAGPAAAYKRAQTALQGHPEALGISEIGLQPFRRPEAQALRGIISIAPGSVMQVKDSNFNGVFFDDVEIYRTPPTPSVVTDVQ